MRIVCPSCAAVYEVPDDRLAPGQTVRCARCGVDWAPVSEPLPPAPETPVVEPAPVDAPQNVMPPPSAEDRPEPKPAAPAPAPSRLAVNLPPGSAVLAGWAASVAILALLTWAAVTWRDDIMRAWPASERAYAAIGLPLAR